MMVVPASKGEKENAIFAVQRMYLWMNFLMQQLEKIYQCSDSGYCMKRRSEGMNHEE